MNSQYFSQNFFLNFCKALTAAFVSMTLLMLCSVPARAGESGVRHFTVFLNNIPHTTSGTVRPCTPFRARFEHPDAAVTRVRMRYPHNHNLFMFFPMNEEVNISLHEDYMEKGEWSLSDFIAEDESARAYGQMTLTFQPLDPLNKGVCESFPDS